MKSFKEYLFENVLDMPAVRKLLHGTKVLGPDGTLARVFHGTSAAKDFKKFALTKDFGYHFAEDPKLAAAALRSRVGGRTQAGGGRTIPTYLAIKNPAPFDEITKADITDSPGGWEFSDVVKKMADRGIFSITPGPHEFDEPTEPGQIVGPPKKRKIGRIDKDQREYVGQVVDEIRQATKGKKLSVMKRNQLMLKRLVGDLRGLGYDGGVYDNKFEGKGKTWVAFDPRQIINAITGRQMG